MQKALSVFLSMALLVGLLSNAVPVFVRAAENVITTFDGLKSAVEGAAGEVVLTIGADIEITGTIEVRSGSTVTLLSAGNHTLKRAAGFRSTMIAVNGTLKLGSENGMGSGNSLTLDGGAVWTGSADAVLGRGTINNGVSASYSILTGSAGSAMYLYAGVTLQNNASGSNGYGGAVTLPEKSALYLYGAVLRNNYTSNGGGAVKTYSGSTFIMNSGEVYGNQAGTHGGAFQIFGTEYLSGSRNPAHVTCTISGGTIRNNLCNRYGGAIAISDYSNVELTGSAKILNNRTTSTGTYPGGGVAFADNNTSLKISGSAMIFGNTRGDGRNDNLHIGYNACNKITVENLSAGSRIGVTMKNGSGVFSNTAAADYSACFFSDSADYCVVLQTGNALALSSNSGLKVTTQPKIPNYPAEKTMSVSASGTGGLSYRWYHYSSQDTEASVAEGVSDTSTYTLPDNLAQGTHFYYCNVSDASGNSVATNVIAISVTHTHSYGAEWKNDDTNHWHVCACGEKSELSEHSYGEWVTDTEATEEAEGTKHRNCTACGYQESGTIPRQEHVHSYGAEWQSNETSHWHVCACGEKSELSEHIYGEWVTDTEATEEAEGTKHRNCTACGYRENGTIPATGTGGNTGDNTGGDTGGSTGGSTGESTGGNSGQGGLENQGNAGAIHKEVEKGENAPETSLSMPEKELENMLLTEAERQQVAGGVNIRIILTVEDAGERVSEEDRAAVDGALGSYAVGQYLDISLFKIVGESQNRIPETSGKIRITIAVPENLKAADGVQEYAVMRVHNGEVSVLQDLDSDADTITIETDRFSTYVIVYQDMAKAESSDSAQNTGNTGNAASPKDNEPKTEDSARTKIGIYATLAMVSGFGYLALYFADESHGMTEEEKKALTARLIRWARRGGRFRRILAIAVIFVILFYYHSIGRKTDTTSNMMAV